MPEKKPMYMDEQPHSRKMMVLRQELQMVLKSAEGKLPQHSSVIYRLREALKHHEDELAYHQISDRDGPNAA